jgi:dTDP-4-amino-4,6-dideoxygalactose transaminase
MKYIDQWNEARRRIAGKYDSILSKSPVTIPHIDGNNTSVYHQYTILAPQRDDLQKFLGENDVGSAIFYPKPLHLQQCFEGLGYKQGDMPVTEELCSKVLSLPVYPEMTDEQIEWVGNSILRFYGSD